MAELQDIYVNVHVHYVNVHVQLIEASGVYLSGPMTGIPLFNRPAFERAARQLQERSGGNISIFNPATIVVEDPTWENYMRVALAALLKCEAVYVLKGWEDSKGAKLELKIAQALGMRIIYEL